MVRRALIPLLLSLAAFAALAPGWCAGGAAEGSGASQDLRQYCATGYGWKLPWSGIDGPIGLGLMYVIPLAAAAAVFLVVRWALSPRRTSA
jgi:hypothetical protein